MKKEKQWQEKKEKTATANFCIISWWFQHWNWFIMQNHKTNFFFLLSPFVHHLMGILLYFFVIIRLLTRYTLHWTLISLTGGLLTTSTAFHGKLLGGGNDSPERLSFAGNTNWLVLLETDLGRWVFEKSVELVVGTVTDPTPPGTVVVAPHLNITGRKWILLFASLFQWKC